MTVLKICLTAVLSIAELFILAKIMGKRQMSQLGFFDYINGITIGSIAAEMATEPLNEFWKPAVAMAVYSIFAVILPIIANKSIVFRRVFSGKSLVLMNNNNIFRKNLSKSKMDANEFLIQCRINGYFNPDELQTVILEPNGQLSFLPKSDVRPVNPQDLNLKPPKESPPAVVISDGKILHGNLESRGKNEVWLREQLKAGNYPPIDKIYLCLCDGNDKLYVYKIDNEKHSRDLSC
jgi:uncharacterized membrane protein YcaP (DUF421 family)